jgi:hypothetical protein
MHTHVQELESLLEALKKERLPFFLKNPFPF